jgi:hypothetical protein
MIFGLNLPNYSSLGHREAIAAIAAMERYGRVRHFRVSMRTRMRIGGVAGGREAGSGLWDEPAALIEQVKQYARAGVDELVIEPAATDLNDFIKQLTRFARNVADLKQSREAQ